LIRQGRGAQGKADGLFSAKPMTPFSLGISKIRRLISIVVETGKFLDWANLPSKSKAKDFDGLHAGALTARKVFVLIM